MRKRLVIAGGLALACGGDDAGNSDAARGADGPRGADAAGADAAQTRLTVRVHRVEPLTGDDTVPGQFLVFQDGDGPWQLLTGNGGVYTTEVVSDRYGIGHGCVVPALRYTRLQLIHATTAERTEIDLEACEGPARTRRLDVSVSGLGADQTVAVRTRFGGLTARTNGGSSVLLPAEATEAVAVVTTSSVPVRYARLGALAAQGDLALSVDAATVGMPAQAVPLAVPALAPDEAATVATHSVILGGVPYDLVTGRLRTTAPTSYPAPPVGFLAAGDLQVRRYNLLSASRQRMVTATVSEATPWAPQLPAPYTAAAPTLTAQPFLRPTFEVTPLAPGGGAITSYLLAAESSNPSGTITSSAIVVALSSGWVGAGPVTYQVPDLTGLPGWNAALAVPARQAVFASVGVQLDTGMPGTDGHVQTLSSMTHVIGEYCGDGVTTSPEACDTGGESATCDADCTTVMCGDGTINGSAGEDCDPPGGGTCSPTCTLL